MRRLLVTTMIVDQILEKYNLKYEDLSRAEQETLHGWLQALSQNELTVRDIKAYVSQMKDAVANELASTSHNSKQDLFLKARVKNYILLEAFLTKADKAKEILEKSLKNIKNI